MPALIRFFQVGARLLIVALAFAACRESDPLAMFDLYRVPAPADGGATGASDGDAPDAPDADDASDLPGPGPGPSPHDGGAISDGGSDGPWVTPTELTVLAGGLGGNGVLDGVGAAARLAEPRGLCQSDDGVLYFVDRNAIRRFDPMTGAVSTLAGVGEIGGLVDGPLPLARFQKPMGLACDLKNGRLFVADVTAIRQLDLAAESVTTLAGTAQPGAKDGTGADARFTNAFGIVRFGDDSLLVSDAAARTLRSVGITSHTVTTLVGQDHDSRILDGVGLAARLGFPRALAWAPSGHLYIADGLLRDFDPASQQVTTVVGSDGATRPTGAYLSALPDGTVYTNIGTRVYAITPTAPSAILVGGDRGASDGPLASARFGDLAGLLAVGTEIFVADSNWLEGSSLRRIDLSAGQVTTVAGRRRILTSNDGVGDAARFFWPRGIAAVGSRLFVADHFAIRAVDLDTGATTTVAGARDEAGTNDGPAATARFGDLGDLVYDGADQLYIVDLGGLRVLHLSTMTVDSVPLFPADAIEALAFVAGRLYYVSYLGCALRTYDPAAKTNHLVAGKDVACAAVDGSLATGRLNHPRGLAVRDALHFVVSEANALRAIDLAAQTVTTIVPGAPGNLPFDGPLPDARLNLAGRITGTGDHLFVVDGHTVRALDLVGGQLTTLLGRYDGRGVAPGPLPATLNDVTALTVLPGGGLALASEQSLLLAR